MSKNSYKVILSKNITFNQESGSSQNYKGGFETTVELLAFAGEELDYADNYETNTRWTHDGTVWVDTLEHIPQDKNLLSDTLPNDTNLYGSSVGTSLKSARADHVHKQVSDPTKLDESRASESSDPNTVVLRDHNGNYYCNYPVDAFSPVPLTYLNDKLDKKVTREEGVTAYDKAYVKRANGSGSTNEVAQDTRISSIAQRTNTGTLFVEPATQNKEAVNLLQMTNEIESESNRAMSAEDELSDRITEEVTRAVEAETELNVKIDNESTRATQAESALEDRIDLVETSVSSVQTDLTNEITEITNLIPTQATSTNQLADKEYVNSAITNIAARFLTPTNSSSDDAQWATFSALTLGPWYYQGLSVTPTTNDYAIYINDSNEVWRAHYTGTQWEGQYKVNDTPFTVAQLNAINSGITSTLVNNFMNKADRITVPNSVYSVNGSGAQSSITYSTTESDFSIVQRTSDGTVRVATAINSNDAVTLDQLNAALALANIKIVGRIFASSDPLANNATVVDLLTLQGVTSDIVPKTRDFVLGNGTNNLFIITSVDIPNGKAYISFFAHSTTPEELALAIDDVKTWVTQNFQPIGTVTPAEVYNHRIVISKSNGDYDAFLVLATNSATLFTTATLFDRLKGKNNISATGVVRQYLTTSEFPISTISFNAAGNQITINYTHVLDGPGTIVTLINEIGVTDQLL